MLELIKSYIHSILTGHRTLHAYNNKIYYFKRFKIKIIKNYNELNLLIK